MNDMLRGWKVYLLRVNRGRCLTTAVDFTFVYSWQ